MTFLVVEGSAAVREALCLALLPHGIKGVPVPDRLAAREALRSDPLPQGAIVDIDDRSVEGSGLVEELKAEERTRSLALIVHTAQANRALVLRLIEQGVVGVLLGSVTAASGPARLERALARVADHHRQRRHIRVVPDAGELVRVSFRLPGAKGLVSGRVIDISLGGMAIELLNPPAGGPPGPGARMPRLSVTLPGHELAPAGTVVTAQGRTVAVRFDPLGAGDKSALERYIFRRISA